MDRLDRAANAQGGRMINIEQLACRDNEQRSQPFAAANACVAHRLKQGCALIIGNRQQDVEHPVDITRDAGKCIAQPRGSEYVYIRAVGGESTWAGQNENRKYCKYSPQRVPLF